MPRVKQIWEKWNRDKSCKSIGKPASSAGRPVPVLGFAVQVVPGRYKIISGHTSQVVLMTVNNMFDGPLKCIFSNYDDFLPRLHGLLQAKVSDQTLVISLCIWLLRSPTVDWKAFIVAHMGEVFRLNNFGLTSGLEDQNNKDKKQKHICIKPNEENVRTRKKSINRHKSDKNKHFPKTYLNLRDWKPVLIPITKPVQQTASSGTMPFSQNYVIKFIFKKFKTASE